MDPPFLDQTPLPSTKNKNVHIIVSHFDENLDWIKPFYKRFLVTVYNKSPQSVSGSAHLVNIGRESHTYLHHIVSHYDNLADWNVFTQASEPSFGYKGHRSGGGGT